MSSPVWRMRLSELANRRTSPSSAQIANAVAGPTPNWGARTARQPGLALVKAFLKAGVLTELGDHEDTHTGALPPRPQHPAAPARQKPRPQPGLDRLRRTSTRPSHTATQATATPSVTGTATHAAAVFNELTAGIPAPTPGKLLVAPHDLRERSTALIRREAGHARAGRPCGIRPR
jgi:hypothetical protein